MSWCESDAGGTCRLGMDMDWFNVLKFVLTTIFLGCAHSFIMPAFEKFRRAMYLRTKSKVCIGSATTSFGRRLGLAAPPTALGLLSVVTVCVLLAECGLEFTSRSEKVRQTQNVTLPFADMRWSAERWSNDSVLLINGLGTCTWYDDAQRRIHVWPSFVVRRENHNELFCPHNVTNDDKAGTNITRIGRLEAAAHTLAQIHNGTVLTDEHKTVRNAARLLLPVKGALRGAERKQQTEEIANIVGTVFVLPAGLPQKHMLECLVHRLEYMGMVEGQDVLGCVGLDVTGDNMLFYKNELLGGDGDELKLRAVAEAPWMDTSQRRNVMERLLHLQPETLQDWLFAAIVVRMVREVIFERRGEERFEVWSADVMIRPTVQKSVVLVVAVLIVTLMIVAGVLQYVSYRMFPYLEIVGEDNIVRVWAREKSGLGMQTGASWLMVEVIDDEQRITAHVDEPTSNAVNFSIPMPGLSDAV